MPRIPTSRLLAGLLALALTPAFMPVFTAARAEDLPVWRHGMTEAKSNAGFVAMVAEPGFAEKYGIKVELIQMKNDALLQRALIAGSLDSYEGGPALIAAAKGGGMKVVGCSWLGISIGLFAKPEITDMSQLRGAKIAASAPGALPDLLTRVAMKRHGIDPAEAEFVGIGSDPERYKSVVAGLVDVSALDMEHEATRDQDHLNVISAFEKEFPGYARFCIHMSDDTLAARRPEAVKFLAAEMGALQFALENPEATIALTQRMTGAAAGDPRAQFSFDHAIEYGNIHPELPVPAGPIGEWNGILEEAGAIDPPLDLATFLDPSLRAEAAKLAGLPE